MPFWCHLETKYDTDSTFWLWCKIPQPVYCDLTQDRPAEKPICICIANVEQLVTAKPPFSPLLWEFMRNVYPGGISCIVSKGDWLLRLGKAFLFYGCMNNSFNQLYVQITAISPYLFNSFWVGVGPAYDRVGTRDSIMIRVPDHTVTCHLCDITGPLAITSANPSGEPDSTHHTMVIKSVSPHRTNLSSLLQINLSVAVTNVWHFANKLHAHSVTHLFFQQSTGAQDSRGSVWWRL